MTTVVSLKEWWEALDGPEGQPITWGYATDRLPVVEVPSARITGQHPITVTERTKGEKLRGIMEAMAYGSMAGALATLLVVIVILASMTKPEVVAIPEPTVIQLPTTVIQPTTVKVPTLEGITELPSTTVTVVQPKARPAIPTTLVVHRGGGRGSTPVTPSATGGTPTTNPLGVGVPPTPTVVESTTVATLDSTVPSPTPPPPTTTTLTSEPPTSPPLTTQPLTTQPLTTEPTPNT